MINPIKDNRIISDHTFAIRLLSFLNYIPKEWVHSQPHYYEEYEYMANVAKELLEYQIETMPDEEKPYFDNIKDIVNRYVEFKDGK